MSHKSFIMYLNDSQIKNNYIINFKKSLTTVLYKPAFGIITVLNTSLKK